MCSREPAWAPVEHDMLFDQSSSELLPPACRPRCLKAVTTWWSKLSISAIWPCTQAGGQTGNIHECHQQHEQHSKRLHSAGTAFLLTPRCTQAASQSPQSFTLTHAIGARLRCSPTPQAPVSIAPSQTLKATCIAFSHPQLLLLLSFGRLLAAFAHRLRTVLQGVACLHRHSLIHLQPAQVSSTHA